MPDNNSNSQSPDTLYIIDGHAQIFRAYFAIRGGMNSPVTGETTQAVFGYAGMLIKLLDRFRPAYVITAFDTPGKTFRDELYPEYKANRDAAPEDLGPQIQRIYQMTKLFGIPEFGVPGAEADDIIATITSAVLADPKHADLNIRIVSKDKDLEQLIGPRVTMFDIHKDEEIDAAYVKTKRDITPAQVIDALALTGDKVDNVPGVEGIGPKTAAKLLNEYGSIDGIYEHINELKGKRKENLEKAREHLPLSKTLVTLKHNVEVDFDMDKARVGAIDANGLRHFFQEMGFRRHAADIERLTRTRQPDPITGTASQATNTQAISERTRKPPLASLPSDGGQGSLFPSSLFDGGDDDESPTEQAFDDGMTSAADYEYTAIKSQDELDAIVKILQTQKLISVDVETIGLGHRAPPCGICLAWKTEQAVYVPMISPEQDQHLDSKTVIETLRPIFENAKLPKCGHNIKYDALVLRNAGVELRGIEFDSMIATHMVGTPAHGMDFLAEHLLNHRTIAISSLIGAKQRGQPQKTMDTVSLDQITPYAAEDADISLRLTLDLQEKIKAMGMSDLSHDVEMPLIEVLAEMEYHGIKLNPDELERQRATLSARIDELRSDIFEAAEDTFNLESPKQLSDVLFNKLQLPVIKKTKTGASTNIEVLEKLSDRDDLTPQQTIVISRIIEYRQLTKLVNTYLGNLVEYIHKNTGRVHAQFHQTGTETGRLSSSNPNLQNIPVRTEVGRQIRKAFIAEEGHTLISADYSQIELRILAHLSEDEALIEAFEQGLDIHAAVAAQVFDTPQDEVTSEQRTHAKTINFGIVYGVTPWGLARRIDNLDNEGAKQLISDYKAKYTGIDEFLRKCVAQAIENGYVTTMLGRRRQIRQIDSTQPQVRALGERLAINTVVQGSAAELIKVAMVNLHRRIRDETLPLKMLLQIHDELILETPDSQVDTMSEIVRQEMEQAMSLKVPLKVDVGMGKDWFSAK